MLARGRPGHLAAALCPLWASSLWAAPSVTTAGPRSWGCREVTWPRRASRSAQLLPTSWGAPSPLWASSLWAAPSVTTAGPRSWGCREVTWPRRASRSAQLLPTSWGAPSTQARCGGECVPRDQVPATRTAACPPHHSPRPTGPSGWWPWAPLRPRRTACSRQTSQHRVPASRERQALSCPWSPTGRGAGSRELRTLGPSPGLPQTLVSP